jgi:ribosomal protein S18 acetylase RimI-like enzyme
MLTTIRHITAEELRSFAQFVACEDRGFAPSSPVEFEMWLKELWHNGQSSPNCCFVADCDGHAKAAAVYWLRGNRAHLEHLRLPIDDPPLLDVLLTESLKQLSASGTMSVWVELITPPLCESRVTDLAACLERVGFGKGRTRLTFHRKAYAVTTETSNRLTFRSLTELGRAAFVTALAEMTADSLDAGIAADRSKKGSLVYATDEFMDQALTRHETSWWEIAYDHAGTAIGIVLTGIVGRQPAILFVAVKPSHRGHGFAHDLLTRGISILRQGISPEESLKESVRGDVDAANLPMVKTFVAAGFSQSCSSRVYERDLVPDYPKYSTACHEIRKATSA